MSKNSAIKVHNLSKVYKLYHEPIDRLKEALHPFNKRYHRDFYALNNVSFEVKKGETVGIIGRNGSGKSTLLKIITGVLTPTQGRVLVHGKISAILELGAGFHPEMSGLENIYLNTSINGLSRQETDVKIDDIIAFSELGEFIHQPLKTYSSGMKARLAFGVAITIEPDILIVDEALAVGDAAFQRKCFAKMEQIREAGATILFVSHSEASIVTLCSRAIWISNAEKIIDAEPKLVTGLYMKNANKKHIDKEMIVKELEALQVQASSSSEGKKEGVNTKKKASDTEAFYDASLTPKSTIYYDEKGAKISNVKITTPEGREVNVLVQGKEYIYSYKVDFIDNTLKKVIFGMSLYMKNGVNLISGNYPKINTFESIKTDKITVKWHFTCNLLNGEYFLTAGVLNDQNEFMARIKDVYMVKVINCQNTQVNGIVDMKLKGTIE